MPSPELDSLIISHLTDIDASVKRLRELQREVFEDLMNSARTWAAKEGWEGNYNYLEASCWLAPPDWRTPDTDPHKEDFLAWFEMELGAGDTDSEKQDEDAFYLTRLCGAGNGLIGFRFKQEAVQKVLWKKRIKDVAPIISPTAFVIDSEPSFFLPFRLDATALANAVQQEEMESAFDPFSQALKQLAVAKPKFDQVLANIKPTISAT